MAEASDQDGVTAADFSAIIDGLDRGTKAHPMSPDDLKILLYADLEKFGFPANEIASVEVGVEC